MRRGHFFSGADKLWSFSCCISDYPCDFAHSCAASAAFYKQVELCSHYMKSLFLPLLCLSSVLTASFANASINAPIETRSGFGTARNIVLRLTHTESVPTLPSRDYQGAVLPDGGLTYSNEYETTSGSSSTYTTEIGSRTRSTRFSNRQFLESMVELGVITEITGWSIVMVTPGSYRPTATYSNVGVMFLVRRGFTPISIASRLTVNYDQSNGMFANGRATVRSTYLSDSRGAANVTASGRWSYSAQSIVSYDLRDENGVGFYASMTSVPVDVTSVPSVVTQSEETYAQYFARVINFTDSRGLGVFYESYIQPTVNNDVQTLDASYPDNRVLVTGRLMTGSSSQVSLESYPMLNYID